jgi:hypothetical protein
MRTSVTVVCVLFATFLAAHAVAPPVPLSLKERVQRASHVFVGVAVRLRVIDRETGKEVSPEPKSLERLSYFAELEVRVVDVLRPADWKPKDKIMVRYGGGFFSVSALREGLGHKFVYLTTQQDSYFVPSYPWALTEPEEKRAEIESFIKTTK